MSDSFLELAQSKISSFVMWSSYVTFRIFLDKLMQSSKCTLLIIADAVVGAL